MNKKRTQKRKTTANWRNTRHTLTKNTRFVTQNSSPVKRKMTQQDWNVASILGVAAVLFNFALKGIQARVILTGAGVFWILFCLFHVVRLLTGFALGVSLSAFAFYEATTIIRSPKPDSFSIIVLFALFAYGLYLTAYFGKRLFSEHFKDAYKKFIKPQSVDILKNDTDEMTDDVFPVNSSLDEADISHSNKPLYAPSEEGYKTPPIINHAENTETYVYNDELLPAAIETVLETGQASTSMLQRRLILGYSRASRLIDQMERLGYVGAFDGSRPRRILLNREQWEKIRHTLHYEPLEQRLSSPEIDTAQIIRDEGNWRREQLGLSPIEYELQKVDGMEGHAFEEWCADLLKHNGFHSVEVTPGSGDQGVDVIAEKDGLKYAIQCKRYSSDLGNTPIQEVVAGKAFYHCHVGAVMTNRYFTSGAKQLAQVNGILLWDRDVITDMLKSENPS